MRPGPVAWLRRARLVERIVAIAFVAIVTIGVTLILDGLMMKAEVPALDSGAPTALSPPPAAAR